KERAFHADRTRAVTEGSSRAHESQERLVQRGFFTRQSISEIGVDLVLGIFEGASLLIQGCVLQIEIHLRRHSLGRSRQFRRQRHFHQRGYDCCSQSQFADGEEIAPRHVWRSQHLLQTPVHFLRILRFFLRRHSGTVQALAAIVTVNALGFVFVPAFRADQLRYCRRSRHTADSFFGLVGGADVDVFGGGVFDSLPEGDFFGGRARSGGRFLLGRLLVSLASICGYVKP